jgi:parallel beta-helix repeat protein
MRFSFLVPIALLVACACDAQDTTAIKDLAARSKSDMDSILSQTHLSTTQVSKNNRAETRVRARQDSIIAAMRKPKDTTTTPAPPGSWIVVNPSQSIQAAVDANPAGTTFLLKAGTHIQQDVQPKARDVFRGETVSGVKATIMDGQNISTFAFRGRNSAGWVDSVHIVNLIITNYQPPPQNGAIWGGNDIPNSTKRWVVDSVEVKYSKYYGVRIGNRMQVLRSNIHHNGTLNIGGVALAVLVDSSSFTFGNPGCVNNPGFEAGGSKFAGTDSLIVRNSTFSDNCGPGLWLDIENIHYDLYGNLVERNYREGICIEISYAGVVHNNTVNANGWPVDPFRGNGWGWDAGIGIHASKDVEVHANGLTENFNGIVALQQNRGNGSNSQPYLVQNLFVHDNVVTQRNGGYAGAAMQDVGDNAIFTTRNNHWENNTYNLPPNAGPFEWSNGIRTAAQWRAYGNDDTGTFNP